MNTSEILEKLQKIMTKVTGLSSDEILPEKSLMNDLDLTSMDVLSMISDIETSFDIRVPEKVLRTFVNVEDIVNCISELIAG